MRLAGLRLWEVKANSWRSFHTTKILLPLTIFTMSLSASAAMASGDSETSQAGPPAGASGRATAIASARIVNSFSTRPVAQSAARVDESGIAVSRRTSVRSCSDLLGTDADQGTGAKCALLLMELQ